MFLFATFRKNGPRIEWIIHELVLDKSKKCLSVCHLYVISFQYRFWADRQHCPMPKKYYKNERHLCLVAHIFTKLLQECVSNTHIFIYRYAGCDCRFWNIP